MIFVSVNASYIEESDQMSPFNIITSTVVVVVVATAAAAVVETVVFYFLLSLLLACAHVLLWLARSAHN